MADQELANLEVQFGLDAKELVAGMRAAIKSLKAFTKEMDAMGAGTEKAEKAAQKTTKAQTGLGKVHFRTTQQIKDQIKKIEGLEDANKGDAIATRDLAKQKALLQQQLQGTTQKLDKQAEAAHRGNLFMINFSRGIEDLKFGLPAVINNLDSIAIGFEAMAEKAEKAGMTTGKVLRQTLTSPAGMLAIMNLIITTAFLLGPTLKKAFNEGRVGAKALKRAVEGMIETPTAAEPRSFFGPMNLTEAQKFFDIVEARAKSSKDVLKTMFGGQIFDVQGMRLRSILGLNSDIEESALEQYEIYRALKKEAEQIKVTMQAQAAAAKLMAKHMREVAPIGSINRLNITLNTMQEEFDALDPKMEGYIQQQEYLGEVIRGLEREISKMESALHGQVGSLAKSTAAAAAFRDEAEDMALGAERTGLLLDANIAEKFVTIQRVIDDANKSLVNFADNALFRLGDAAVAGAFDGLFGDLGKGNADQIRLSLIGMEKEWGNLEKALAEGKISYEEFALRNKINTEQMEKAQREFAHATQGVWQDIGDRIENTFEGVASSVKSALKSIAQEMVTLFVKRRIASMLMGFFPGSGLFGTFAQSVGLGANTSSADFGFGGGNYGARIAIEPRANVIPSGDLQISLRQANATSSRTGL